MKALSFRRKHKESEMMQLIIVTIIIIIILNPLRGWEPIYIMNVSHPSQLLLKHRHRQAFAI